MKTAKNPTNDTDKELYNLWEDMDEGKLNDMNPVVTPITVPVINGDAATIKCLANNKSIENIGL